MSMEKLSNRYFALRHGESMANVKGIIVSRPDNGCLSKFGLSEKGKRQARALAKQVANSFDANTIVMSSDFARAKETAQIVSGALSCQMRIDKRLRERDFGELDGGNVAEYAAAWQLDTENHMDQALNIEPPQSVADRMLAVIESVEEQFDNRAVILVSHGDPLQILEAVLCGRKPHEHRQISHLSVCELRQLPSFDATKMS